ncbi:MAG: hypothetical protein NEA02_02920 [Thermoanaerobaculia bacterium]|nr:hypothetical protein [Thermoanaerobaculia bacterium]
MNAGRALAVLFLSTVGASFALAEQPPPADAKTAPAAEKMSAAPREKSGAPGAPAAGGLVVFIDPVTGKIRQPDAAEIGSLVSPPGAVTPPVEEPLVMKTGPGGAVGLLLDSRFESFMVVTKKPDGTLAMACVEGKKKADDAVAASATPARPARKSDGAEAAHVR